MIQIYMCFEVDFPWLKFLRSRLISPSSKLIYLKLIFQQDAKSRFQAVVASTAVKSTIANTLRRASLERQNPVQQSPTSTPDISRDNSQDKWVVTWQNQQNECVPSEDSDHLPSLIRVFTVRSVGS